MPSLAVSLTASDYHGYNISCNGAQDGSIDLTISGGTAPYVVTWSNKETTEDISGLAAGYYKVAVVDMYGQRAEEEITLTEPLTFHAGLNKSLYPNGYNVSCFECFNGTITPFLEHGVSPFTYLWDDGPTTATRSILGPGEYKLTVTDANGCRDKPQTTITQPDRTDWTMSGNAGTNPSSQYFGTSDNKDLVLKSNGTERLRLNANGNIVVRGGTQPMAPLYVDSAGVLRSLTEVSPLPTTPCAQAVVGFPYWKSTGNTFTYPQCDPDSVFPIIGTRSHHPVAFITDNVERMFLSREGRLGIGTRPPSAGQYRLFVDGGIATRDVQVKLGTWPDFVFDGDHPLMPFDDLRTYLTTHRHLPGIPSATELEAQGGVEVGDMQRRLVQVVEEQSLYILKLEERLQEVEQRLEALAPSKR